MKDGAMEMKVKVFHVRRAWDDDKTPPVGEQLERALNTWLEELYEKQGRVEIDHVQQSIFSAGEEDECIMTVFYTV